MPRAGGPAVYEVIARPVVFDDALHGVVIAGARVDDAVLATLKRVAGLDLALVAHGHLVASTLPSSAETELTRSWTQLARGPASPAPLGSDYWVRTTPVVAGTAPVAEFVLIASHAEERAFVRKMRRSLLAVTAAILAVSLALSFTIARGITTPLRALAAAARRIGAGDLDSEVHVRSQDELGALGDAFNDMTRGLRERDRLRRTFERYVSKDVAAEILQHPEKAPAFGVARELTVCFVDIGGFTGLAERLGAEAVVARLNEYFEVVCGAALARHGTVNEFVGDSVVVYWGAPLPQPDHAARACLAALARDALTQLTVSWRLAGLPDPRFRIGLHTGELVVGEMRLQGGAPRLPRGRRCDEPRLAHRGREQAVRHAHPGERDHPRASGRRDPRARSRLRARGGPRAAGAPVRAARAHERGERGAARLCAALGGSPRALPQARFRRRRARLRRARTRRRRRRPGRARHRVRVHASAARLGRRPRPRREIAIGVRPHWPFFGHWGLTPMATCFEKWRSCAFVHALFPQHGGLMSRIALALFAALLATASLAQESWYPSRYGADDRVGAANNLSAAGTKRAAQLVTTGKTYSLGMTTGPDSLAYPPRKFGIVVTQSNDGTGTAGGENKGTGNDDILMTYMGIGSQLDGLGHLGIDHRYYNGLRAQDFVAPDGLKQLGTDTVPPIATRGVLLDMAALKGVETVPPGTPYNRAEIDAAVKRQGIAPIGKGDVVLFHSGWHATLATDRDKWWQMHAGVGVEGARYLADQGVVAVGADSTAVEVIPFENEKRPFEVHQTLLAKNGVYILENMWTTELAKDGAHEFLFVLGQPKFVGAVQMVVNPIAIR